MTAKTVEVIPCAWSFYRARFTGQPVAECLTCGKKCVYWEDPEELSADCDGKAVEE